MSKFLLLLSCVHTCASVGNSGKCAHDASAKALTHALLEEGYEAYKEIECIPAYLFAEGGGGKDVELSGKLISLVYIEKSAFFKFEGKITWTADCPNLKEVGTGAFDSASNIDSTLTFGGTLKSLERIKYAAFAFFKGKITFNAACANLKEVGNYAFMGLTAASTVVLNNAPRLETIGVKAFDSSKGNVQVVGEYARLRFIGAKAFGNAVNSASRVEVKCASDGGLEVDSSAFDGFGATRVEAGEQIGCMPTTTSSTSSSSTTTFTQFTATTATTVTETATTPTTPTTTTTATALASTTARLQANDECDPSNDGCDKAKNLVCVLEDYTCRYGIAEESTYEKKSSVGAIVGSALGGVAFLIVFGSVAYCCGQRESAVKEVRRRAEPLRTRNQQPDVPQPAYGQTVVQNPTFDDSPAPAYAEIDEEPVYEPAVPGREIIYDQGRLAGARDHVLRDKRLSQQLANSYA